MKKLKENMNGIIMCLLEIIVGVLLLMNPVAFTGGIIVGTGIVLVIMGIGSIIAYFHMGAEDAAKSQSLLKGMILLLIGLFCIFKADWFIVTFPVITLVYGVVILITGLAKVQWMVDAIRMKKSKWFLAGVSALLSIICGVIIITSPFSSTAVLWMFTGISLIIEATFDIVALFLENKSGKSVSEDKVKKESDENNIETEVNEE